MPRFIKRKTKQIEHEDYTEVVRLNYTKHELAELLRDAPSKFLTVSESHAADVIRPQDNYQEVPDEIKAAPDVSRPAAQSQPRAGEGRSSSGARGSGGNRGNGRQHRSN